MKTLSLEQMEKIKAGKKWWWLEAGCIIGGLSLSVLSGPAFALTASATIHVCGAYILSNIAV